MTLLAIYLFSIQMDITVAAVGVFVLFNNGPTLESKQGPTMNGFKLKHQFISLAADDDGGANCDGFCQMLVTKKIIMNIAMIIKSDKM